MDALEAKLQEEGSFVEEHMQNYLIDLYSELVPYEKQKYIDTVLAQEKLQLITQSI